MLNPGASGGPFPTPPRGIRRLAPPERAGVADGLVLAVIRHRRMAAHVSRRTDVTEQPPAGESRTGAGLLRQIPLIGRQ